jgi:cysteinyl-tRNA synthetase
LNYSDAHLDDAKQSLTRLYTALKEVAPDSLALDWGDPYAARFAEAMNDDFNTPLAVAVLFELAGELNKAKSAAMARQLKQLAGILGLLERTPSEFPAIRTCTTRPGHGSARGACHDRGKGSGKERQKFCRSRPYSRRADCIRNRA